jgi:curved DNA-binding protein
VTEFKDYYKTLGVAENADQDAIKKAYRRLARKYHPDVSKEPDAEARFKELGEAYEALKDPERRRQYDELRRYGFRGGDQFKPPPNWGNGMGGGFAGSGASGFSDFFDMLFGGFGAERSARPGQNPFAQPGRDLSASVSVDLEMAIKGGTQRIAVGGRTLNVKIPAGVGDGQRIRLSGQGEPGQGGGAAGHLYLEIHIKPHPTYKLDGRHVLIEWPVSPWEAALGTTITVPTPKGSVSIKIPPGTSSHQRLRLKDRGLPAHGQLPQGDAFVVVKIKMPNVLTPEERAAFETLKELSSFDPRAGLDTR